MSVNQKMTAIANAIRAKTGGTDPLTLDDMPLAITEIETGGGGESSDTVIMNTTTLTFTDTGTGVFQCVEGFTFTELEEGKEYEVVFDGEPYKLKARTAEFMGNPACGVGNLALLGTGGENTGESFVLGTQGGMVAMLTIATGETHTVKVVKKAGIEPFVLYTVTVKLAGAVVVGAMVTAKKGETVLTGVTDNNGQCVFTIKETGTYLISVTRDGITASNIGTFTINNLTYSSTYSLFSATITVATETGATVTVEKGGKTQTVVAEDMQAVVPVYETGTYTVTSSYNGNSLTKTVEVLTGTNYNLTIFSSHLNLEETSWEAISQLSAEGNPQNYFAVGDTKSVRINGKIINDTFDVTLYAYILGFNHNESVEGKAIHFGTFKTADGKDVALCESKYGTQIAGSSDRGFSFGNSNNRHAIELLQQNFGQSDCEMNMKDAYNITYTVKDSAKTTPTADRFLAALPADLLAVLKSVPKTNLERRNTTSTSHYFMTYNMFLNVLSEYEVFGTLSEMSGHNKAATIEQYQKQYEYYKNGNSRVKYKHNAQGSACDWWLRDQTGTDYGNNFTYVTTGGAVNEKSGRYSAGLAPIFFV